MDLENISQPTLGAEAPPKKKRRGKRRAILEDSTKIGMKTVGKTKADYMKRFYERRRILSVPQEILDANPDKHFCFVNMNKLEKNGMWHPGGYRLFNLKEDSENQLNEKFNSSPDNLYHRNEMVLAWLPKEEHEERLLEAAIVRGKVDLSDIITRDPNLTQGFHPHASHKKEILKFPQEEKI